MCPSALLSAEVDACIGLVPCRAEIKGRLAGLPFARTACFARAANAIYTCVNSRATPSARRTMEIFLSIAIGYCVVCWLLGFLVTRSRCYHAAIEEDACAHGRNWLVEWSVVLFAPIYMPIIAVYIGWGVIGMFREVRV